MKVFKFYVFAAAMSCVLTANAQPYQGDFLLNGGVNVFQFNLKANTLTIKFFEPVRFGFDLNYFAADRFAISGGFEYTDLDKSSAAALGLRLFLSETIFLRSKGYYFFGRDKKPLDISFGFGNDFMLSDHWAVEANADYYVQLNAFVFRLGMGVFF